MNLRDLEQQKALEAIRVSLIKNLIALVVCATGYGKGHLIKLIASLIKTNLLVVVPRVNLVEDIAKRIGDCSIYCASLGKKEIGKITVCTKQSIEKCEIESDVVILDECFDDKTEILTEDGFVLFSELKDQKVAQFNEHLKEVSFVYPERKIERKYSGEMVNFYSDTHIDLTVTKNHEMLVTRHNGKWEKVKAVDMLTNHYTKIHLSGKACGKDDKLSPVEKLAIMLQADGSMHSKMSYIFSFSKDRKIKEFLSLMKEGGFHFTEYKSRPMIGNVKEKRRFLVRSRIKLCKDITKYISIKNLSFKKAREIIEYMVIWDGSIQNSNSYLYSNTDKKATDFYQAVAALADYRAYSVVVKDDRSDSYNDIYRLNILKKSKFNTQRFTKKFVKYEGNVYCVTVPSGNIVVRRNGKVVVTGNCHNYRDEFLEKIEAKYIIGMTATPWTDQGLIYPGFFPEPCYEYNIADSIKSGFLCDFKMFGAQQEFDVSKFKELKREYTQKEVDEMVESAKYKEQVAEILAAARQYNRKKVAILCASIDHAEKIHCEIHGSAIVHSKLKSAKDEIKKFRDHARFCVSVLMLSEGFDMPEIDMVVFLRPTKSSRLMVQAAGRGLRIFPGKDYCLMMDFGSVFQNCGSPINPVIPDKTKSRSELLPTSKRCADCLCIFDYGNKCPECGSISVSVRDPEKGLNATALLNETKIITATYGSVYVKDGSKNPIKKARNGAPYLCLRLPTVNFVTVFGRDSYRLLKMLSERPVDILFSRYIRRNGKLGWKYIKFN